MLDHREGTLQVHLDYRVPLFFRHVEYHAVSEDTRAGDDYVELAEAVEGCLNDGLASFHCGDRLVAGGCLAAVGADLIDNAVGEGNGAAGAVKVGAGVDYDDLSAFLGHEHGDAPADAPAGPGYYCHLAFKKFRHFFSLWVGMGFGLSSEYCTKDEVKVQFWVSGERAAREPPLRGGGCRSNMTGDHKGRP